MTNISGDLRFSKNQLTGRKHYKIEQKMKSNKFAGWGESGQKRQNRSTEKYDDDRKLALIDGFMRLRNQTTTHIFYN